MKSLVKLLFVVTALTPFLFICSPDTRWTDIKPGTQISYSPKIGHSWGKENLYQLGAWLVKFGEKTITIRSWRLSPEGKYFVAHDNLFKRHELSWIEERDRTGPMPKEGEKVLATEIELRRFDE